MKVQDLLNLLSGVDPSLDICISTGPGGGDTYTIAYFSAVKIQTPVKDVQADATWRRVDCFILAATQGELLPVYVPAPLIQSNPCDC